MEYKILNNGTAVLMTRQPKIIYNDLCVKFVGAPENSTAIFETMGIKLYRNLNYETCIIPKDKLKGVIKITVAVLEETTPTPKWVCDEITAEPLNDGGVLIAPNALELEEIIVDLRSENAQLRNDNAEIKSRLEAINKRLNEIMNAYDIT